MKGGRRLRRLLPLLIALGGCAGFEPPPGPQLPPDLAHRPDGRVAQPWPGQTDAVALRARIGRLLPDSAKDKAAWAADLHTAFAALKLPHAAESYCAAIAVIEQESGFQTDPTVPGLPAIVHKELERRAEAYHVPMLLVSAALLKNSPDGRSYDERINALKTEKQLSDLFDDMIGELPFGKTLFADYNPVRTAGPMQVGIAFAESQVEEKPYPYPIVGRLRDEVFSRRGGVYFGSAILLDYPAPYTEIDYRFADFNAGRYSSRNAAFQAALSRYAGQPLMLDGDLLRYHEGKPTDAPSQAESLLRVHAGALRLTPQEIRRDLLLEKSAGFGRSPLYLRLFALAEQAPGQSLPRQAMPEIDLKSPKIVRKLTTEWFARRVGERYRKCLLRADKLLS